MGFFEGADVASALLGAGVTGASVGGLVGEDVPVLLEGAVVGAAVMASALLLHSSSSLQNPSPMTPSLFSQARFALHESLPIFAAFP